MKLLTDQEIAHFFRETFKHYPITDVAIEAICHNLQNPFEGYIIVDDQDRILFLSEANEKFFSVQGSSGFLKPTKEIYPASRLEQVMRNAKAEIGEIVEFPGGKLRVISRFPITRDGKIVGAYGKIVFANVDRLNQLNREIDELRSRLKVAENDLHALRSSRYSFENIIGESPGIKAALALAQRVCLSDASVLLIGETGTGKEMFANALHFNSRRMAGPFVRVNCAAIPDELAEAEFFGYKQGAFTGAHPKGKHGLFHQSNGGTIFLDEVHELSLRNQSKILRVLQEKEFTPVGAEEPVKVDFRLIAATNRDLSTLVRDGKFRGDLYFRVNRVPIIIPPLRERGNDVRLFVEHFNRTIAEQNGRPEKKITAEAMHLLLSYSWPGNVRELANVLEQAFWTGKSELIEREDLPPYLDPERTSSPVFSLDRCKSLSDFLHRLEKEAILKVLKETAGSRVKAAQLLGIHRTQLYKKIRSHRITDKSESG